MKPIQINRDELIYILETTPHTHNIMLLGETGIGKSEILTSFYESRGYSVVPLFLGQMSDAGDLLGLPKDNGKGSMDFLAPVWWESSEKKMCLFLDEINRARPEILQVVFDLVLNRKLGSRTLPKDTVILSAANYGDIYKTTHLDPALLSRFSVYDFKPSVNEWVDWATGVVDSRVVEFIRFNPEQADVKRGFDNDPMEKTPDRRAWVRVSGFIDGRQELTPVDYKGIAGIVGAPVAGLFKRFIESNRMYVDKLFLSNTNKALVSTMEDMNGIEFVHMNDSIISWFNRTELSNDELKHIQKNFVVYLEWLLKKKHNEALSHLVNITMSGDATSKFSEFVFSDRKIKGLYDKFIANQ